MELQGKGKKAPKIKRYIKKIYTNIFVVSLLTQFSDFQNYNTLKWTFFFPNIFKQCQAKKGEPGNIQHSNWVLKN